ncbi:MAG: SPFH domain-containing protein [Flavobacteriaceae bacterium]
MISFIKKQFSKVIAWEDQTPEILWAKWHANTDEIINASKLIVKPGQGAAIVYQGELADVITDSGIFNLKTDNHPFITTLLKIRQGFESEHKLNIYFFRTAQVVNMSWGTSQPIKYQDPVYKFPIEMGCNGSLTFTINNPEHFYKNVIGSLNGYSVPEAKTLFIGRIPTHIATFVAQQKFGYNQIDAQQMFISKTLQPVLNTEMENLGLQVNDFKILGTYFYEETREHIQKIAQIQSDKYAAEDADMTYEELERLRALRDAAQNEGGLAGAGIGLGAGMELGKDFADKLKNTALNPEATQNSEAVFQLIEQLKGLFDKGILTEAEFTAKKQDLLKKL